MGRPAGSKNKTKEEETKIDTSEGGLVVTSHIQMDDPIVQYEDDEVEPTINSDITSDPNSTPASAMLAIGRIYNDAGMVSAAISNHLRTTAGQPELFSFLQRMQHALGDFRHAVDQVESSASEEFLDAIESAVA